MEQYFVYILKSTIANRTYVGQTEDVETRIKQHNLGKVRSTKAFRPWILFHHELFATREQARIRENWYKSPKGREKIAKLFSLADKPEIV